MEVSETQYNEYNTKIKQGYKANININNDVVEITYVENKKKTYIKELQEIKNGLIPITLNTNKSIIG